MALASQFDVKEPQDLLRGLSNVLSEYEMLKEDGDKPKIVRTCSFLDTAVIHASMFHSDYSKAEGPNDQLVLIMRIRMPILRRHTCPYLTLCVFIAFVVSARPHPRRTAFPLRLPPSVALPP